MKGAPSEHELIFLIVTTSAPCEYIRQDVGKNSEKICLSAGEDGAMYGADDVTADIEFFEQIISLRCA